MKNEISKESCCEDTMDLSYEKEKSNFWPSSKKQGVLVESVLVKNITVKHLVINKTTDLVGNDDYLLCMDEDCDIVYYNSKSNVKFNKQEVKVPIWFKKDANPKYACYCSKVTEEEIIDSVVKDGATTMKEVLKITGAMTNAKCQIKNPAGKCCHQIIQNAIDKGLSMI